MIQTLRYDTETIHLREQEISSANLTYLHEIKQFVLESYNSFHRPILADLETRLFTNFKEGLSLSEVETRLSFFKSNQGTLQSKVSLYHQLSLSNWLQLIYIAQSFAVLVLTITQNKLTNSSTFTHLITFLLILYQSLLSIFSSFSFYNLWYENYSKRKAFTVEVTRNGNREIIDSQNLVIGDIIYLVPGCKIPADLRIIHSENCRVDMSSITGENLPRILDHTNINDNLIESGNVAFESNFCTEGFATGVVVATGKLTFMSRIYEIITPTDLFPPAIKELKKSEQTFLSLSFIVNITIFFCTYFVESFSLIFALQLSAVLAISLLVTESAQISRKKLLKSLYSSLDEQKDGVKIIQIDAFEGLEATETLVINGINGILVKKDHAIKHVFYNNTSFDPERGFNKNSPCFREIANIAASCLQDEDKKIFIDYFSLSPKKVVAQRRNRELCFKPYTGQQRYIVVIVHDEQFSDCDNTEKSYYTLYIRSNPDFLISHSAYFQEEDPIDFIVKRRNMTKQKKESLIEQVSHYNEQAERVFAFGKKVLPGDRYPRYYDFYNQSNLFGVELNQLEFVGFISRGPVVIDNLIDSIHTLKNEQAITHIVSSTSDQQTTLMIANQLGLISESNPTNIQIQKSDINVSFLDAIIQARAVVISGDRLERALIETLTENVWDNFILNVIKTKMSCLFVRFYSSQNVRLVLQCKELSKQKNRYNPGKVTVVVGSDMNSRESLRPADIGVFIAPDSSEYNSKISKYDIQEQAGIVLSQKAGLKKLPQLIDASRKMKAIMIQQIQLAVLLAEVLMIPFIMHEVFGIPLPLNFTHAAALLSIVTLDDHIHNNSISLNQKKDQSREGYYRELDCNKTYILKSSRRYFNEGFNDGLSIFCMIFACLVGFAGYCYQMNSFGFPVNSLVYLIRKTAYFSDKSSLSRSNPFSNSILDSFSNCNSVNERYLQKVYVDWHGEIGQDSSTDLRSYLLKCDSMTGKWIPSLEWGDCSVSQQHCFSQDAVIWSQTAYFACVAIFISLTSIRFDVFDPIHLKSKFIQIVLIICLIYIPVISEYGINARPIDPVILIFPVIAAAIYELLILTIKKVKVKIISNRAGKEDI